MGIFEAIYQADYAKKMQTLAKPLGYKCDPLPFTEYLLEDPSKCLDFCLKPIELEDHLEVDHSASLAMLKRIEDLISDQHESSAQFVRNYEQEYHQRPDAQPTDPIPLPSKSEVLDAHRQELEQGSLSVEQLGVEVTPFEDNCSGVQGHKPIGRGDSDSNSDDPNGQGTDPIN